MLAIVILSMIVLVSLFCFGLRLGKKGFFIGEPKATYLFRNKYNPNKNTVADLRERARFYYLLITLLVALFLTQALFGFLI